MTTQRSLIVGLPLDHDTEEVLAAAKALGERIRCPIVAVHALGERRLESKRGLADRVQRTKHQLTPHLALMRAAGMVVREEVAVSQPADLIIETAHRVDAELIVAGGGRPATVRRWLVGSVAEAVVRRASIPVWIARGVPPGRRPVLCPVDLSPQSELGLTSAIRMARLFEAPLRVLTVLSEPSPAADMRQGVDELLAARSVEGLDVDVTVVTGSPAEVIVDAADDAGLLVIGSRGFDPLFPESLGPVTTRALRSSRCNLLAIREVHVDLSRREHAVGEVADAHREAWRLVEDDRAAEALPLIEGAAERAPFNATIQETYAIVLEKVGRDVEARGCRELAALIRARIGP